MDGDEDELQRVRLQEASKTARFNCSLGKQPNCSHPQKPSHRRPPEQALAEFLRAGVSGNGFNSATSNVFSKLFKGNVFNGCFCNMRLTGDVVGSRESEVSAFMEQPAHPRGRATVYSGATALALQEDHYCSGAPQVAAVL